MTAALPKRLIEVDLPIKRISKHARREKSIRHGHISTLHTWWARRPLAACRAVICASLWLDPADPNCPDAFRQVVRTEVARWVKDNLRLLSKESLERFISIQKNPKKLDDNKELRYALLDFIADFANWDNSTVKEFLDTSRALTQAAHEALGGVAGTKPLVVDPFAGGGSIPLEALRVGADVFASDLNPIPVLLNKVILEYIPKYGQRLADEVRKWGEWIKREAEKELAEFYPKRQVVPDELKNSPLLLINAKPTGFAYVTVTNPQEHLDANGGQYTHYVPITTGQAHGPTAMHAALSGFGPLKLDPERRLKDLGARPLKWAEETPIAYLWARTIQCEGPGCGAEVPLIRSLWLAKKSNRSIALQLRPNPKVKRVDFQIITKQCNGWVGQDNFKTEIASPNFDGTVKRGSATCPCCGYTTPVVRVRGQLKAKRGGTNDARLYCVVTTSSNEQGRTYRLPVERDFKAAQKAARKLAELRETHRGTHSLVPDESTVGYHSFVNRGPIYGMTTWEHYFTPRQLLALTTLARLVRDSTERLQKTYSDGLPLAVQTCLAFVVDKMADKSSSLCRWKSSAEYMAGNTFGRQALPMVWDFCETNVFGNVTGDIAAEFEWVEKVLSHGASSFLAAGHAELASATSQSLPNDAAHAFITDPPYYYSVQYSDLSDFFYVWLRRSIGDKYSGLLDADQTPKEDEIIVQSPGHQFAADGKNNRFYETRMKAAMEESCRVLSPSGIGVVVFAHTSTSAWESQLQAMLEAGWIITGSWPIDTEMAGRVIAQGRSVLASSIHLVCRPRESPDGSVRTDEIGDWRDVLLELPRRIHEWMPRLAKEGVVGADAIFACLGPALEIFSRYSSVEKANGDRVRLREFLEHVWAAVAKEALVLVFEGADASGFEEDARLTAMWLWTLSANQDGDEEQAEAEEDDESESSGTLQAKGYVLEYDAARKIAQGLGAHLESLASLVEVKGEIARLLPVAERTRKLFGKDETESPTRTQRKKSSQLQLGFVAELEQAEEAGGWGSKGIPELGITVLDRVHQCMILFAAGRAEAVRRFLIDEGVGADERFWRLAQVLSYLYPKASDEKRWIDGVLARKKGLGF